MRKNLKFIIRSSNTGLFIAVLIIFIILSAAASNFLSALNLYTLGRTLSIYCFIGLAQAITLVAGNMNLSVGAIGGLSTITTGYLLQVMGYPGWVAVIAGIAVGVMAGAFNGLLVSKLGMNSFVVTLGTLFFYTGLVYGLTKGFPFNEIPKSFLFVGKQKILGVPLLLYITIICLVVVFLFFRYSIAGRRMLTVGENPTAAKFSGVNVSNIILLSHMLSGLSASIGAILYVSRIGSASPQTGQDWLVISFAVAIIGGTALSGGMITAFGLFLGGVLMVMIKSGLVFLKANIYWEQAFLGTIILIAVVIDRFRSIYSQREI